MKKIRVCNLFCEYFLDNLVEFSCNYAGIKNVSCEENCSYNLPEVSQAQKKERVSRLEKEIRFQRISRDHPEKISRGINLKIIT